MKCIKCNNEVDLDIAKALDEEENKNEKGDKI